MSNRTHVECYFKSDELAALCKGCTDIVIHFNATYYADAPAKFEIFATQLKGSARKIKSRKPLPSGDGGGDVVPGCPTPCK
ncbi:hypothetical protein FW778_22185 [Ginsengibacter hankyongi]|uniref:Uncharacterized protein n=1 Tax=Ginsengibacter hankyongi TaxID=2607284 RepID=A0A5J5IDU6_9BACT|nr:hypothetical protein [Ginsengibacter hankyongi]KAA9034548.1 hypothetical protein FW778_22185 [Ginsengibacter hankyongi]